MTINIRPDWATYIDEKVHSGKYSTPEDVVDGALRLLKTQETLTAEDVEELRRDVAIGLAELDCGQSGPWNVEEIKADGRRMLDARRGRRWQR